MKQLVILQTVAPDYRKKVFTYLHSKLNQNFKLLAGEEYFEPSIKSDHSILFRQKVRNHFFWNRKFLIQSKISKEVLANNILVLEMNPRIISNWGILFIRGILGRKTVLWGHAWPRQGAASKSDMLRNAMRKLGTEIVVYTKTQQKELQKKMRKKHIFSAPNSVFFREEMRFIDDIQITKNVIYVGRLTTLKKPLFLVKAFHAVIDKLPGDCNLILIGEGEERERIQNYVEKHNLSDRITTPGHISEYETLRGYYNQALVSVSPGYIGLSVTQSFGFGVPMIVSRDENHSPEIEAIRPGFNALFFDTDNAESFGSTLLKIINHKQEWVSKRAEICNFCAKQYSVEVMAEHFIKIAS